jgi:coenzyme F420-reducing hydrogenase delta subunit
LIGVPITAQIKQPVMIVVALEDGNDGVFAQGIKPRPLTAETPAVEADKQRR